MQKRFHRPAPGQVARRAGRLQPGEQRERHGGAQRRAHKPPDRHGEDVQPDAQAGDQKLVARDQPRFVFQQQPEAAELAQPEGHAGAGNQPDRAVPVEIGRVRQQAHQRRGGHIYILLKLYTSVPAVHKWHREKTQ